MPSTLGNASIHDDKFGKDQFYSAWDRNPKIVAGSLKMIPSSYGNRGKVLPDSTVIALAFAGKVQ
jgi:hypothetical protein